MVTETHIKLLENYRKLQTENKRLREVLGEIETIAEFHAQDGVASEVRKHGHILIKIRSEKAVKGEE